MNKKETFVLFDDKIKADNLPYMKIGMEYFRVTKKVELPNKCKVNLHAILAFKKNELIFFNIKLPIGRDYTYYEELRNILKHADTEKINAYLYKSDRTETYNKTNYCSQWFGMERSEDHINFQIFIKYGSNEY